MPEIPKVSVIIPTYNRAQYICDALNSVMAQTYPNFQIIIVDDGSTDNTREVLEPYMDRIRYVCQGNAGVSAARNRGVQESRSLYLAFIDSDDLWHPKKLESQIPHIEKNDIIGFHNVEWFVDKKEDEWYLRRCRGVLWPRVSPDNYIIDPILDMAECRYLQIGTLLCHRSTFLKVGLFDESLCVGEDYDWFSRAAMLMRFHYLKETYLKIRYHASQTGLGTNGDICTRSQICVFQTIKKRTKGRHRQAYLAANNHLASKISQLANIRALAGRKRESFYLAFNAFLLKPRCFLRLLKAFFFLVGWKPSEKRVGHD